MTRFRRQPSSYWALLISLLSFGALWVADMLLGWGQAWIQIILLLLVLSTGAYTMRMLWKQSDPGLRDQALSDGALRSRVPGPVPVTASARDEPTVPRVEADDTIAPRPEEEIADAARAEPDLDQK